MLPILNICLCSIFTAFTAFCARSIRRVYGLLWFDARHIVQWRPQVRIFLYRNILNRTWTTFCIFKATFMHNNIMYDDRSISLNCSDIQIIPIQCIVRITITCSYTNQSQLSFKSIIHFTLTKYSNKDIKNRRPCLRGSLNWYVSIYILYNI